MYLTAAGLPLAPATGTASEIASEGSRTSAADLCSSGLTGEVIVVQPIGERKLRI